MRNRFFTLFTHFAVVTLLVGGLFVAEPAFAQDTAVFAQGIGLGTATLPQIITTLIRWFLGFLGVIAVVFLMYGGFTWMTAGGNADKVKTAKAIILNAIIGLVVIFFSYAIVSFVLGAIGGATSGDGGDGDDLCAENPAACLSGCDLDPSACVGDGAPFQLLSVNNECSASILNLQLQFVFSQKVDPATVETGIMVLEGGTHPVEGTFEVQGSLVTFTPSADCGEFDSAAEGIPGCFYPENDYVTSVGVGVESIGGQQLDCLTGLCGDFEFYTGIYVDLTPPTVEMTAPASPVYADVISQMQAKTTDDSGVSTVNFLIDGDATPLYSAGATTHSSEEEVIGDSIPNFFFSDSAVAWDPSGYVTNASYEFEARALDCAGNETRSDQWPVRLYAANCHNGVLDAEYEKGQCDSAAAVYQCDCGGDAGSPFFCGECPGNACETSVDCATGMCVDNVCVSAPRIDEVSPGDGAEKNLITIIGSGFGTVPGEIAFLGDPENPEDDKRVSAYVCADAIAVSWKDAEVIVQVPEGAVDGAIMIATADAKSDTTDNDFGPYISPFDVNNIERPGICALDPNSGESLSTTTIYGLNFAETQGASRVFIGTKESPAYPSWTDVKLEVGVPSIEARSHRAQVFTGQAQCVDSSGEPLPTTCVRDVDCDTDAGQTCGTHVCSETLTPCEISLDCEGEGEMCLPVRRGSNKVSYTVTTSTTENPPVINYVDSGWRACLDGVNAGFSCSVENEATDCPGSTCEEALNWGPAGQYLTIFGEGFGDAGVVKFQNNDATSLNSGQDAIGNNVFPEHCSVSSWSDTEIVIKVPEAYQNESPIEFVTHKLRVERTVDPAISNEVDFVVRNDAPGPAICGVDPVLGPPSTEVTILGEYLGSADGSVTFWDAVSAVFTFWGDEEIEEILVPLTAETGPLRVSDATGRQSNPVNFEVGNCQEILAEDETADACPLGTQCCADGSCAMFCENAEPQSYYAYKFSTSATPDKPSVVVACNAENTSPAPWDGWSDPESVCVNAEVRAEFDRAMMASSLVSANVEVLKCDGSDAIDPCEGGSPVLGAVGATTSTSLTWQPTGGAWEPSTQYQVTLLGGSEPGDIQAQIVAPATVGAYMEDPFTWTFTTASSTEPCEVGSVNVVPPQYTATELGEVVDYEATLRSAGDSCVPIMCVGPTTSYDLEWSSNFAGANVLNSDPSPGVCTTQVEALAETPAGDPAAIEAVVTNSANSPSDTGLLTINYVDPEVIAHTPACETACINSAVFAHFNVPMYAPSFTGSTVQLWECANALCAPSEMTQRSDVSISYTYIESVDTEAPAVNKATVELNDVVAAPLLPNTYYRVIFDGAISADVGSITPTAGPPLSLSGSNYGSDENQFYAGDYSWIFRTKNSSVSCAVDRIDVLPRTATAQVIGDRQAFDATAYGAPDSCAAGGQPLQPGSVSWSAWTSVDTPDLYMPTSTAQSDVTAYMLQSGSIGFSSGLPAWCAEGCLNAGSARSIAEGICGNGIVEDGEECDSQAGCSATTCLWEGNVACEQRCSSTSALCTVDTECQESCGGAVCTDFSTAGDACVIDAECGDSLCVENVCVGAADVGEVCSSSDQCDNTCLGACTLSGAACSKNSECIYFENGSCDVSGSGCCGDGVLNQTLGEACDDGNLENGDGCSSSCLNEGSYALTGAVCGNGQLEHFDIPAIVGGQAGGESCDDGNTINGDGCSAQCLSEGTPIAAAVYATCGNGGPPEPGEDCDDGNLENGDGCSAQCLNEGTVACVLACYNGVEFTGSNCLTDAQCGSGETCEAVNGPACCGNGVLDAGEDCEVGDVGCSAQCLNEGSSAYFGSPSYCGDGVVGDGEECDASAGPYATTGYGVAEISLGAVQEVSASTSGYAISTISATAGTGGVTGEATYQLQCACEASSDCGSASTLGCGVGSCCFERPTVTASAPPIGATNLCRNTGVWVSFDQRMDEASLRSEFDVDGDGNISSDEITEHLTLVVTEIGGLPPTETTCPFSPDFEVVHESFLKRIWNWVTGLFTRDARAQTYVCAQPVQAAFVSQGDTTQILVNYTDMLLADANYTLTLVGDGSTSDALEEGLLSSNGVGLSSSWSASFSTGDEICSLDLLEVEDWGPGASSDYDESPNFFTSSSETHYYNVTPFTIRTGGGTEALSPTSAYAWDYVWSSSIPDSYSYNVVRAGASSASSQAEVQAQGQNGRENVLATATITTDTLNMPSTVGDSLIGSAVAEALICENPWPALPNHPFIDASSNVAFSYCRDAGEDGTDDDLPALLPPVDVTSVISLVEELVFQVEGSRDAIGLRVVANPSFLPPELWYVEQGFSGSPSSISIDGYEAIQDGTTTYIAAPNVINNQRIYSNIYVVSFNDDASALSQEVFNRFISNIRLNANFTDAQEFGVCTTGSPFAFLSPYTPPNGSPISCQQDVQCADSCVAVCADYDDAGESCQQDSECDSGSCFDGFCASATDAGTECEQNSACATLSCGGACSASGVACTETADCPLAPAQDPVCTQNKSQLQRDLSRLHDAVRFTEAVSEYGESRRYCEVTTDQQCVVDADCPGAEACLDALPPVSSGTLIPAWTTSRWPSWISVLGNELGIAPVIDPVNEFIDCTLPGADPATCYDGTTGTFQCLEGSHIYGYNQSIDADGHPFYTFYTNLEFAGPSWIGDIGDGNDNFQVRADHNDYQIITPNNTTFFLNSGFCEGATIGDSAICGDGVVGTGEACDIGTSPEPCDLDGDGTLDGYIGNSGLCETTGVIWGYCDGDGDGTDDGTVNLTCNASCQYQAVSEALTAGAECVPFSCGNGVVEPLAGEQCDDGDLNGTYGFCDNNCLLTDSFYCGDGYLAGGEQCDCGSATVFNNGSPPAGSWSDLNGCTVANGQYVTTGVSCAYDCTVPGPTCGDGFINGTEQCDGGYETWAGAFCQESPQTKCVVSSPGCTCGGTSATNACGTSSICLDYADAGESCTLNAECDSGSCSAGRCTGASDVGVGCSASATCASNICSTQTYETHRYRACSGTACTWNGWSTVCTGADQICGNGQVEGDEVCDDGNTSNNDGCTNTCELNICGDQHVYVGVESCDSGSSNGQLCTADYGGICNYCSTGCQLQTRSGGFCGDSEINGPEACDGSNILYSCVNETSDGIVVGGACDPQDAGVTGSAAGCASNETCRLVGSCDGGTYGSGLSSNGDLCTPGVSTGSDTWACGSGGTCVEPICADSCVASCPTQFETTSILAQNAIVGSVPTNAIDLYSYDNPDGNTPDNATLLIPACRVATNIRADVDASSVSLPDTDIVFVTDSSGSMRDWVGGGDRCDGGADSGKLCGPNETIVTCADSAVCTDEPVIEDNRMDIAIASLSEGVEDLFDFYNGSPGTLRIALVDYDTSASVIHALTDAQTAPDVQLSAVTMVASGYTATGEGIDLAIDHLGANSTAPVQVVVTMSDGSASTFVAENSANTPVPIPGGGDCGEYEYTWENTNGIPQTNAYDDDNPANDPDFSGRGCYAQIRYTMIEPNEDISFYSALINENTTGNLAGRMAHISSASCVGSNFNDYNDCQGPSSSYYYAAEDELGVEEMYASIIDSIVSTSATFTTQNEAGDTVITSGSVEAGLDTSLPFPNGFSCEATEQLLPLRVDFNGVGTVHLEDFELTYCPLP